jgi:cytochrome c oxidase subunit 2
LAPHSPGTDQISTLLWIGIVAGAIVVVLANAGLLYALRSKRRDGGGVDDGETGAGRRLQLRAGATLTVFAAAILVLGIVYTGKAREVPRTGTDGFRTPNAEPLKIEATGQQWLWRYQYPNESFSHYKLVVPVDTTVELDLVSTDVVHTWDVPELAGKREAVPGRVSHVVFRADEEGSYFGEAATLSGQGYAAMRTEVDVVSPPEYEAFIERQQTELQAAQSRVERLIESGQAP